MKYIKETVVIALLILTTGADMDALEFLGFSNSINWKEEVLLHDGQKIILERSQNYGGRHEIGQPPPIKEHTISFILPISNETITWTIEYGKELGRTNFNLLAVHVLNNTPYIVASPNLCLSYNKWDRPNPPYVFFKYEGKGWKRIPLEEFPIEFKTINVALDIRGRQVEELQKMGSVPAEKIKKLNAHTKIPEYQTILREPLDMKKMDCVKMIQSEDGAWLSIDWFTNQPTYEACLKFCDRKKVNPQKCPCDKIFNKNIKEK